jgi:hypothetical protein
MIVWGVWGNTYIHTIHDHGYDIVSGLKTPLIHEGFEVILYSVEVG